MIDHDAVAINAEVGGPKDFAIVRSGDGRVGDFGQVETEVDLLIYFLAFIYVAAAIGEVRLPRRS